MLDFQPRYTYLKNLAANRKTRVTSNVEFDVHICFPDPSTQEV